jgi:glucose-6-phosphate isomerase
MTETYGPRTKAWRELTAHAQALRARSIAELFRSDARRFEQFSCEAEGVLLDFSRQLLDRGALNALLALAEQTEVSRWVGHALRLERRRRGFLFKA